MVGHLIDSGSWIIFHRYASTLQTFIDWFHNTILLLVLFHYSLLSSFGSCIFICHLYTFYVLLSFHQHSNLSSICCNSFKMTWDKSLWTKQEYNSVQFLVVYSLDCSNNSFYIIIICPLFSYRSNICIFTQIVFYTIYVCSETL